MLVANPLRNLDPAVKICGITTLEACDAACNAGAAFIGFVFAPSPRLIAPHDAAAIAQNIPPNIRTVAVCVDPDDAQLDAILHHFHPSFIQLHGNESPARAQEIYSHTRIPIIKALRIAESSDLLPAYSYNGAAHMLLLDAKSSDASTMGGTGHRFDWRILDDFIAPLPWFLSGGLHTDNVQEAIQQTNARYLDVSSGVEASKGVKDLAKIASFMEAVKAQR